ncbi:MAG: hypothetical protein JOZ98_16665 [Solirubrobacterales bacterium]|nr:hypothetical protein [Solirubrobacterales bacterium]
MRSTLSGLAGRLVTGPLAFLVAGVVDVLAFAPTALGGALAKRLGSFRRPSARRRHRR